ncbi:MAG TPA: aldolase/citrate lyase family protein [Fluviicoccus sp.]|nr:aldolase/citrate lyase family protein [Fluviicoccus sp.]
MIKLMFITNSPELAAFAVHSGVDRIFVDLETMGKFERQGHRDTLISRHAVDDVAAVRAALPAGTELLVRINPWHEGSAAEVDAVIAAGADLIMLPMVRSSKEVAHLGGVVRGRSRIVPLVETVGGAETIADIAALDCVSEVFVGLNDLHMELGLRFMFEPLADGLVETLAGRISPSGKPFGFGGIARVGEGLLPAERILGEHVRLGSSAVILSRTFHRGAPDVAALQAGMDFPGEIARLRQWESQWRQAAPAELEANRLAVSEAVAAIVTKLESA